MSKNRDIASFLSGTARTNNIDSAGITGIGGGGTSGTGHGARSRPHTACRTSNHGGDSRRRCNGSGGGSHFSCGCAG